MRRDSINYMVVGVFVLTLFALLLIILYQITGRTGPTDSYYVTYSNVEGIKYGTPVLFEGFQIGQVDSIEPVREGGGTEFKLTLAVTKGWQIPDDSVAEVVKSGLLSAVAIDIEGGQSQTPLMEGSFIRGKEATDIFTAVNEVAADIKSLSRESVRPLLDNLNKQVDSISGELKGLSRESIRPILDKQVRGLLEKLDESAAGLRRLLGAENQNHINVILSNLNLASNDLRLVLGRIDETRVTLDRLLVNVDKLVDSNDDDVRTIVVDMKESLYAVSQHIDAIAHHMEGSSRNMQEFTRQLRENPGLLLRGSPPPDEVESQ